jgi:hypothetical protein
MSQTPGLFTLDEIGTTRSYEYTEATLISPGRYTARTPMSTAAFCTAFFAHYPALEGMDWSNVAVRGGAVVDILLGRPPTDLDFFLHGMGTPEGFVRRAGELLDYLLRAERASVEARNAERKREAEEAAKAYAKAYGGHHHDHSCGFQAASISIKGLQPGLRVQRVVCQRQGPHADCADQLWQPGGRGAGGGHGRVRGHL